jgi:hypothetical protein
MRGLLHYFSTLTTFLPAAPLTARQEIQPAVIFFTVFRTFL